MSLWDVLVHADSPTELDFQQQLRATPWQGPPKCMYSTSSADGDIMADVNVKGAWPNLGKADGQDIGSEPCFNPTRKQSSRAFKIELNPRNLEQSRKQ